MTVVLGHPIAVNMLKKRIITFKDETKLRECSNYTSFLRMLVSLIQELQIRCKLIEVFFPEP